MVKKLALLLPIIWSIFYTSAWGAEPSLIMNKLEIQIMPEFIQPENAKTSEPSLLTGMFGTLIHNGATPYTGEITIQVPKADDISVHLVGEFKDGQSTETKMPFTMNAELGTITWKPSSPIEPGKPYFFVVEYYSYPFSIKETNRSFTFPFTSKYDIEDLQVFVYKPLGAESFQLSKTHQQVLSNEFGQEIFHYQVGLLKKGTVYSLNINYVKEDNETVLDKHTVIAKEQAQSSTQQTEAAATEPKEASKDAWIIGGAIVIFGILVFIGLRSFQKPTANDSLREAMHTKEAIMSLRTKLIQNELTEEEYIVERKKLIKRG